MFHCFDNGRDGLLYCQRHSLIFFIDELQGILHRDPIQCIEAGIPAFGQVRMGWHQSMTSVSKSCICRRNS